jgi:hypothetical protein
MLIAWRARILFGFLTSTCSSSWTRQSFKKLGSEAKATSLVVGGQGASAAAGAARGGGDARSA